MKVELLTIASIVAIATSLGCIGPLLAAGQGLSIGSPAPDFKLTDLNGKEFNSSQLRGSIVLLDLWATWCEPCVADLPMFNRLHEKFSSRGVKVVGVAVESGWAKDIKPHVAKHSIKYTVLVGNEKTVEHYQMIGFPTTYLIGTDGKIVKKYIGTVPDTEEQKEADLNHEIEMLLEVKKKAEEDSDTHAPRLVGLKPDEQKVVRYLLKDWGKDFSITSIDVALGALGLRQSDEVRFRVGNYIKNHPELHSVIRQWGWQTVALTPDEKLVARAIVNPQADKLKPPSKADIANAVGISEKDVDRAVAMLARYGILKRDKSAGGTGYIASESRYVNWQPWLDFQFHRVALTSGRIFNTN